MTIGGMEHLFCCGKLERFGFFSAWKREGLRVNLLATFQYLKGAYKKDGESYLQ